MRLKRTISAMGVFSIASGAMISSGLFVLPSIAYRKVGSAALLAYFFAGLLMIPALLSKLELITALPKAGGTYFFSQRILGSAAGVVAGFANWISISLKSAFALAGIGVFATLIVPDIQAWHIKAISVVALCIFAGLNLVSVKHTKSLQVILVLFLIGILLLFNVVGYRTMSFAPYDNYFAAIKWGQVWAVTGMVFISYGGLTKVASISEDVIKPRTNIVKGVFTAFIVVEVLYLATIFVLIGILPADRFISSPTPISHAAWLMGPHTPLGYLGLILTAIGGILAFVTTANAGIMAASRDPLAMSRDGLLPPLFGHISKHYHTPIVSIVITALFMLFTIVLLDIEGLAKVASLFMLMLFIMVNVELIIMRLSNLSHYQPSFHAPLFPVLQIIGIVAYAFLIAQMGITIILAAAVFILLALGWYFIYVRKQISHKSALVHMLEHISGPELAGNDRELEDELLDILLDGHEIVEDRFDKLIRQAPVFDYAHTVTRNEMFNDVAGIFAQQWDLSQSGIASRFEARELDAPTVIYPGVAIPHALPHIVVEGTGRFAIVLVRNKFGIKWTADQIVYTAFCLLGSKDERTFHLRSLAAIAQILMEQDFYSHWMNAKNNDELRSLILLSKRRRHDAHPSAAV